MSNFNGDIKSITAYVSKDLGMVSGYDSDSTEFIIEAFEMNKELAEHFRGQIAYNNQEIGGVLGLRNASDSIYDIFAKDLNLIQPPFLPNINFDFGSTALSLCF